MTFILSGTVHFAALARLAKRLGVHLTEIGIAFSVGHHTAASAYSHPPTEAVFIGRSAPASCPAPAILVLLPAYGAEEIRPSDALDPARDEPRGLLA